MLLSKTFRRIAIICCSEEILKGGKCGKSNFLFSECVTYAEKGTSKLREKLVTFCLKNVSLML